MPTADRETMTESEIAVERDYVTGVFDSPHLYDVMEVSGADIRARLLATIDAQSSELLRLRDVLRGARGALKPFAKIASSAFYAEDGSDRERYQIFLQLGHSDEAEFNGMDLAKARAACASIDAVLAGKGGQDG